MSLRSSSYLCPASLLALLSVGCPGPEPSLAADGTGGADPAGTSTGIGPGGPASSGVVASSSSAEAGTSSSATSSGSGLGGDTGDGGSGGAGQGGGLGGAGGASDGGGGAGGGLECASPEECKCEDDECHVVSEECKAGKCVLTCESGYVDILGGDAAEGRGCETRGVRVFVTSTPIEVPFSEDAASGVAGAHERCTELAPDGEWWAWIGSESFSPAVDFTPHMVPYLLLDNTVVATDWEDLVDGSLDAAISMDEDEGELVRVEVWTGTAEDGEAIVEETCGDWTNEGNTPRAFIGRSGQSGLDWVRGIEPEPCLDGKASALRHLYCFERID